MYGYDINDWSFCVTYSILLTYASRFHLLSRCARCYNEYILQVTLGNGGNKWDILKKDKTGVFYRSIKRLVKRGYMNQQIEFCKLAPKYFLKPF